MAQALRLTEVSSEHAARRLAASGAVDPAGIFGSDHMRELAETGRCFAVDGPGLEAVYVVRVRNGVAWVSAAAGAADPQGVDVTGVLDAVLTLQAQGLRALATQTARPGLRRKLQARGWRVTGWILRKELQCS